MKDLERSALETFIFNSRPWPSRIFCYHFFSKNECNAHILFSIQINPINSSRPKTILYSKKLFLYSSPFLHGSTTSFEDQKVAEALKMNFKKLKGLRQVPNISSVVWTVSDAFVVILIRRSAFSSGVSSGILFHLIVRYSWRILFSTCSCRRLLEEG